MKEIIWGIRKARLWLNSLPDWTYEDIAIAERRVQELEVRGNDPRCVAVEMVVPVGGRAYYGALGATFIPQHKSRLTIQIRVSADRGRPFYGPLVNKSERSYIGFPQEYVEGFLDDMIQFEGIQELGAGTLSFTHAIHGTVGSSKWFFQVIGHIVVRLLSVDMLSLSEEELIRMFQRELRNR